MFVVLFEVQPHEESWNEYLDIAKLLRPELEAIEGFVDNTRFASARTPGRLLSLSTWRDEKALVRWRTLAAHHDVQERGRAEVFEDYHLRVGQVTADNQVPDGQALREQRLDETETGAAKTISIVEAERPADLDENAPPATIADRLGLPAGATGLVEWDVFEAILTAGRLLLLLSWRNTAAADAGERANVFLGGARVRRVRVVRDYGMFERHEAPQYYAEHKKHR